MAIDLLKRAEKGAPLSAADYDATLTRIEQEAQAINEKGTPNGYASLGASGRVPVSQLGSGTPDGTKFLRDDGTFAAPGGGGGASKGHITVTSPGFVDVAGYDILHIEVSFATFNNINLINGTSGQIITIHNRGAGSMQMSNPYAPEDGNTLTFFTNDICNFQYRGTLLVQTSSKINVFQGV